MINPEGNEFKDESQWLERLAYRMVKDRDAAKDVVQATYLAALNSPRPADRPARAWLRRVATNVVRMEYRGRSRRVCREESVAVAEHSDNTFDMLRRQEATQALTTAVQALAEPYRSAVLLRFVDELSIAEVAAAQGVAVGTAGWRVSEGLKRLRITLDSDAKGDCRPWLMALCPLVPFPEVTDISDAQATIASTTGANQMIKLSVLFAALCAASITTYVGFNGDEASNAAATPAAKVIATPVAKAIPGKSHSVARSLSLSDEVAEPSVPATVEAVAAAMNSHPSFTISFAADGEYHDGWTLDLLPTIYDTMELLTGCYSDMLRRQPNLEGVAGTVHVDVKVEDVGGQASIATDTEHVAHFGTEVDDEFRECMRESSFVLEFEPPVGEPSHGQARITMEFPDNSEAGKAKQAASQACLTDLQRRRPQMFSDGDFNDPIFATCMDEIHGEMDVLSEDVIGAEEMPEAFKACLEVRNSSESPSAFKDCIEAAGGTVSVKDHITE